MKSIGSKTSVDGAHIIKLAIDNGQSTARACGGHRGRRVGVGGHGRKFANGAYTAAFGHLFSFLITQRNVRLLNQAMGEIDVERRYTIRFPAGAGDSVGGTRAVTFDETLTIRLGK